jgi:hypothetical protein
MNKSRRHHGFVYGYGIKRHFQQYFNYIVAVSVLLEGTRVPGKTDLPQTASHENFNG